MEQDDPHTAGIRGPSTAGLSWTSGGPLLRMEDAVVETVVTHTTRTTTSFAPIVLPRIPQPETLGLPRHLSIEQYPLALQPAPADMQFFNLNLGGRRVVIQDESSLPGLEGPLQVSGPGWTKSLLSSSHQQPSYQYRSQTQAPTQTYPQTQTPATPAPEERIDFLHALNQAKGKEVRKRPYDFSRPGSRAEDGKTQKVETNAPPITASELMAIRQRSPPRKKIRGLEELSIHPQQGNSSLLSPLPSPEHDAGPSTPSSNTGPTGPTLGSGLEMSTLLSLPALASQFDNLPDRLQQHFLMHLLRRTRMPTIQRISTFASIALKRDFIALLPHEVAVQILRRVDRPGLAAASRVCKRWKRMIDTERTVWQQRLIDDDLWYGHGVEEEEEEDLKERYEIIDQKAEQEAGVQCRVDTPSDDERMLSATVHPRPLAENVHPTPLQHIYRRRVQNQQSWLSSRPEHTSFPGHGTNVVTCLQFDEDKIVSASDDHSINIYNTSDGRLRTRLEGHEGGVWTLQYKDDILVSGSTDRTVRIWDLEDLREEHVFNGHTSTVRCLQIVDPVYDAETKQYQPPYPMIVTGSRDATLRVWRLPRRDDPPWERTFASRHEGETIPPERNPYHLNLLEGHTGAVRALATHGKICVSGSYDMTVRIWDIVKGTCLHVLTGHEAKVYSIVYDKYRNRCASGSMDNTVKVWDVVTGECLHTLTGHTSLVGLLGISPNHLVSAAADASLRVWDPETLQLKHVLSSHTGAITCFQHDETKIISGSDGSLKLWDARTGHYIRDLVVGISSVWQVAFNGNLLVAASNRGGQTVFDVFNFATTPWHTWEVDDDSLDLLRVPKWERGERKIPKLQSMDEWEMPDSPTPGSQVTTPSARTPLDRWGPVLPEPPSDGALGPGGSPSQSLSFGLSPRLNGSRSPSQTQVHRPHSSRRSTRLAGRHSLPSHSLPGYQIAPPQELTMSVGPGPSRAGSSGGRRNPPPAFNDLSFSTGMSPTRRSTLNNGGGSGSEPGSARSRFRRQRLRDVESPTPSAGLVHGFQSGSAGGRGVGTRSATRSTHPNQYPFPGPHGSATGSSFVPNLEEADADIGAGVDDDDVKIEAETDARDGEGDEDESGHGFEGYEESRRERSGQEEGYEGDEFMAIFDGDQG